ncbi:zincin [Anaeromyces robustus]|uniref:Zincin n=1 Tax=Anaeromyces robustus TaxID=1754192 RepID=A0A1Y1X7Z5_9FUNG|nr:zincin [Anaeromyces robustus]|eukprot:ORX81867.1 zincin [Anaeromyces robustus]
MIINTTSDYFEKLNSLLKNTESETIATYIEWIIIKKYSSYLSSDIFEVFKNYSGTGQYPKNLICIILLNQSLSMNSGEIFNKKAFGADDKKNIEVMIKNIEESMNKRISELSWLDETTKENANKKAHSLIKEVGYPDFIMNPKELYEYSKDLEIDPNEFFNNLINYIKFKNTKDNKQLETEESSKDWVLSPIEANAYYKMNSNKYVFPAGILQSPFYNSFNPNYLNYGGIGMIIGHELSHAFDNNGKLFDYEGKLNNWWTNSTSKEFENLSQCFVKQYNQYYITDTEGEKHYINGSYSLGENLGDNGGISRSYEAWKLSLENDPDSKEKNKSIPGLSKYTHDQLFFIAFGQNWCSKNSAETNIKYYLKNEHPPSKFRVIGTISNSEYFATAFKCKKNSPMNPEKKCKIW